MAVPLYLVTGLVADGSTTARQQPLRVPRGTNAKIRATVTSAGAAVSLVGATCVLSIREKYDGQPADVSVSVTSGSAGGVVDFPLYPNDTLLDLKTYLWDVVAVFADGTRAEVASGAWVVLPTAGLPGDQPISR